MSASIYERLYRTDLPSFAKFAFNELSPKQDGTLGWHVDVIADALQGCLERGAGRLIINAPPRSLKSHCVSVAALIFALGHNPMLKIMVIAGSRPLANDLQRRALALMRSSRCRALFPHLRPTETAGEIILPHGGGILYATVGQSLIGRGADIIVIDDPIAPSQAQDDAQRAAGNAWYDAEVSPRLNDKHKGSIIVVMQRVHPEDLAGHVRQRGGWTEIVLPAIALDDEVWPLRHRRTVVRPKGQPLQPEREDKDRLIALLQDIEAYNFSAQYLQQPIQPPGLQRVGYFYNPRPADWQPEMGLGGSGFFKVRESCYILFEVFGVGPRPPYASASSPYSDEEWEAAARIQQKRLVAEARGDKDRRQEQGRREHTTPAG